jgi:hypothetical protein
MFPGDPALGAQGGWTEVTAGNKPGDRRFLQSAGPFTLKPGAVNKVTVGVVWARATTGGAVGSLDLLRLADDKAQKLYLNQFKLIDGPDAPDVTLRELNNKLILSLENTKNIENYVGSVVTEKDSSYKVPIPNLVKITKDTLVNLVVKRSNGTYDTITQKVKPPIFLDTVNYVFLQDSFKTETVKAPANTVYKFQGYQIYQLANSTVTQSELDQADKARLVAQVDLKDEITDIVNIEYQPKLGNVPVKKVEAASNDGIKHTFDITTDAFSSGDPKLINFKFYYYLVISYSVATDPNDPTQYLPGRKNVTVYTGVPHPNNPEFGGSQLQSDYGDGPKLTRIEGEGNGGNILDLTPETVDTILRNNKSLTPTYEGGKGPVSIKIYDPTKIEKGNYELRFFDSTTKADPANGTVLAMDAKRAYYPIYKPAGKWVLKNLTTGQQVVSENPITKNNEQLVFAGDTSWGFAVTVNQPYGPGVSWVDETNSFQEATLTYGDESNRWLDGVQDVDANSSLPTTVPTPGNWIRSGKYGFLDTRYDISVHDAAVDTPFDNSVNKAKAWMDINQSYSALLNGTIAPGALAARSTTGSNNSITFGPVPGNVTYVLTKLKDLSSVDLVFTPDRSKWSKCMVLEMGESPGINEGQASKFDLRKHDGWRGEVDADGKPVYDPSIPGMSMFPGYAINVETGERLNVFFGEDSHLPAENGADMLWNPSSNKENAAAGYLDYNGRYLWGGKHWVYVMNSQGGTSNGATIYDGCARYYNDFKTGSTTQKLYDWSAIDWIYEPVLATGSSLASVKDGIIPTEAHIRLRVSKPYASYNPGDITVNKNGNLPYYTFSTDDIAPIRNTDEGKSALDLVNIVPNPYYATSLYETSQLDDRVRFTNIPTKCEISIFTLDGTLVRRFDNDQSNITPVNVKGKYPSTFLDWDLKNTKGVPVASGVYIVHFNGYELGEKTMKWFGIMKPVDLDTF